MVDVLCQQAEGLNSLRITSSPRLRNSKGLTREPVDAWTLVNELRGHQNATDLCRTQHTHADSPKMLQAAYLITTGALDHPIPKNAKLREPPQHRQPQT